MASTLFTVFFPFPLQTYHEFGIWCLLLFCIILCFFFLHLLCICKQACFNINWYYIEDNHLQLAFLVEHFVSFVFGNKYGPS